jgi:hypothetical protein
MARHPVNPGDDRGNWLQDALPLCASVQMLGLSHRPIARISRPSLIIAKRAVAFPIRHTTKGHSLHSPEVERSEQQGQLVTSYTLVSAGYDIQRHGRIRARRLVEVVGVHSGETVLDVAIGTGYVADLCQPAHPV